MKHTDYRTLVDRGRKAGLKTSELYSALSGYTARAGDFVSGPADSNGFISRLNERGHAIYRPQNGGQSG